MADKSSLWSDVRQQLREGSFKRVAFEENFVRVIYNALPGKAIHRAGSSEHNSDILLLKLAANLPTDGEMASAMIELLQ